MAAVKFFGYTVLSSQTEKEIQKLFQFYEKTLSEQKLKMFDDITEWGDALMRSIYKYVNKQKEILEKEYAKRISYLNKKCQQFVDELRVHEETYNTEQIAQLLDRCRAIKYKLAELEHHGQTIPFIGMPGKDPLVKNQDEFNLSETENDKFNHSSTVNYDNEAEMSIDIRPRLNQNLPLTDTQSSRTNAVDVYNQSTSSDDDHKNHDVKDHRIIEKCPTCFMIFPATMTISNRSHHIQEHYTDD